ncbi:hypothetical protein [Salininema proteolyticum]|uniref:Uncharacterized protein n=1 Tax=Salininema proteolyticum TaxID=1607685 RepID=A0ABV8TU39_9ACTN
MQDPTIPECPQELPEEIYWADVPEFAEGEPRVRIAVSAFGGGTVGKAYAGQTWAYAVLIDTDKSPEWVITGDDLRSGAMPATHEEMVRTLATFLSADGEHVAGGACEGECSERICNQYDEPQREFLEANRERFALFSA